MPMPSATGSSTTPTISRKTAYAAPKPVQRRDERLERNNDVNSQHGPVYRRRDHLGSEKRFRRKRGGALSSVAATACIFGRGPRNVIADLRTYKMIIYYEA